MTTATTNQAIAYLETYANAYDNRDKAPILAAIAEWAKDAFEYEKDATVKDVIRYLETTDCSACHAPPGLIYNYDIAAKVPEWWNAINDAVAAYHDETGQHILPRDGAITIGFLVWFAVEWYAHEMASALRSHFDLD